MRTAALLGIALASLASAQTIGNCPVFPADSIWNTAVDQLPVSPSSSTYINTIGAATGLKADFGSGLWDGGPIGIPFITVSGSQTKYSASFLYAGESDAGPYAVPLTAPIEGGSQSNGDRHAIAIDVDNCVLYELYRAFPQAASWRGDSGAIFNLRSHALRPATWTSADAAGLAIFPGLVRFDEILTGEIRHAIRFTVPQTLRGYVWPGRHYASSLTDPKYPPMGARFRLRADFDISTFSPINQIILRAMKKYGMMISDNGSAWYVSGAPDARWNNDDLRLLNRVKGSDFQVVDVTPLMLNPDSAQARQTSVIVSVSPSSASVAINATRQFSATVTGNSNPAVTWDVNGTVGGNSVAGWVNATGLYTAPNIAPSGSVSVRAISQAAPAAFGAATVSITSPVPVTVTISPTSASLRVGKTRQFVATVNGSNNKAVTWKVNGIAGGNSTVGTVTTSGFYRAPWQISGSPRVFVVSATSVAAPSVAASANVTVRR